MMNNKNKKETPFKKEEIVIPVVKEYAVVDKQKVDVETVEVTKSVKYEQEEIEVELFKESIEVERVPKNKYIEEIPEVVETERHIIYPVVKEEIKIIKQLVLVEEVHVKKVKIKNNKNISVELRTDEVNIERKEI